MSRRRRLVKDVPVRSAGLRQRCSMVIGLALVLSVTFVVSFDGFVVNVAGPSIRRDLRMGNASLELIIAGYALAYAAGLIPAGRMGDVLGYKRMFVAGTLVFGAATLLCGLSQTPLQLILARMLQGVAASIMSPQVLAYITASFDSRRRAGPIAWYGVVAGLGSVFGQASGGILVEHGGQLGWRLIFLVNLPMVTTAAVGAALVLPAGATGHRPAARRSGFDYLGAFATTLAVALTLVPLTLGPSRGWPRWTVVCVALVPVVVCSAFVSERRVVRSGGVPVLPPPLLRSSTFQFGTLACAGYKLYFSAFLFMLTLLLQDGLGLAAVQAGFIFAPAGVAYSLSAMLSRMLFDRFGVSVPLFGCVVTAAGLAGLLTEISVHGVGSSIGLITLCATAMSLGNGVVMPVLTTLALSDVPGRLAGAASGLVATVQQFAAAAGVALVGAVDAVAASRVDEPAAVIRGAIWSGWVDMFVLGIVAAGVLGVSHARAVRREEPSGL